MEKSVCGIRRSDRSFDRHLSIWRCQNRYDGSNNWGNAVKRCLYGLYALKLVRFNQYYGLPFGFSIAKAGAAAITGIFVEELQNISSMEFWNDIAVLLKVRGDASFGDCLVGLTMVAVVVVEIWGEIPHFGEFGGDLKGRKGMECQGVVLWSCKSYRRWGWVSRWWVWGLLDQNRCGGCLRWKGERSLTVQFALFLRLEVGRQGITL